MKPFHQWPARGWLVLAAASLGLTAALAQTPPAAAPRTQPAAQPAQISQNAQRTYETTRDKLVQIRTLLRNSNTQASVGSGFFVAAEGLIITNFHVASQLALEPERYRGVYVPVDGKEAAVELLAFDVRNDLALLRVKAPDASPPSTATVAPTAAPASPPGPAASTSAVAAAAGAQAVLTFRPKDVPLARGERIYSLGNPLDIGFAVTEGTFNGLVQRSFYPRIFFGGALNPGMSGGPALDDAGRVIGVNVSKRLDGDLVSFLIPAEFAQALLERGAKAQPITKPAYPEVARQLMEHQELLTRNFMAAPLKPQRHGGYSVPVPEDSMARCWGRGRDPDFKAFDLERTDCQIDSHVFAGDFNTGFLRVRYEAYDAPRLGPLRFAALFSQGFRNEYFQQRGSRKATAVECSERFVNTGGMDMRAVVCVSAYRKLPGLHDVSVLVASLNRDTQGVQGRLDAQGVSFDNGMKLVSHYLAGFKWEAVK